MPTWSILVNRLIRPSSQSSRPPGEPPVGRFTLGRGAALVTVGTYPYLEESMAGSVIVNGARTPMGRLLGSLKDFSGADLGGFAIKAALERSGVTPDQVQYVIMGQVLQAGAGQIPARQAAHKAGI